MYRLPRPRVRRTIGAIRGLLTYASCLSSLDGRAKTACTTRESKYMYTDEAKSMTRRCIVHVSSTIARVQCAAPKLLGNPTRLSKAQSPRFEAPIIRPDVWLADAEAHHPMLALRNCTQGRILRGLTHPRRRNVKKVQGPSRVALADHPTTQLKILSSSVATQSLASQDGH
jgi:hypothetical protein